MHGASGLADGEYKEIVESGISKVCYYTAMGKRAANDLHSWLADADQDGAVYHEIISSVDRFFPRRHKRRYWRWWAAWE